MSIVLELWEDLRSREGPFHFIMRGFSMWPAAPDGSLLAVDPSARSRLAPGDLVTFRRGPKVITHRVFAVAADGAVATWGDTSQLPDGMISPQDILGRATVIERAPLFSRWWIPWVMMQRASAAFARTRRRVDELRGRRG
jgi:signal peptidase